MASLFVPRSPEWQSSFSQISNLIGSPVIAIIRQHAPMEYDSDSGGEVVYSVGTVVWLAQTECGELFQLSDVKCSEGDGGACVFTARGACLVSDPSMRFSPLGVN